MGVGEGGESILLQWVEDNHGNSSNYVSLQVSLVVFKKTRKRYLNGKWVLTLKYLKENIAMLSSKSHVTAQPFHQYSQFFD